jgi:1,4-alpha-glucan branching enzyme
MLIRSIILLAILSSISACAPKSLAPEISSTSVRFFIRAPAATSIAIAGTFNRWDAERDLLAGPDGKGIWSIRLKLPPGRHEYRYVINGTDWIPDPTAMTVDDGLGGRNSVITIEPERSAD